MKTVLNEQFEKFNLGELPYDKDHSALGEYHFVMDNLEMDSFYDPITCHQFRSQGGNFLITSDGTKHYLESNRGDILQGHFKGLHAMLIYKEELIPDYELSTQIRFYDTLKPSGLCFCYLHSLKHLKLVFENQKIKLIKINQKEQISIIEKDFAYNDLDSYTLLIKVCNGYIFTYINENLIFKIECETKIGKVGFTSLGFVRYSYLKIEMTNHAYQLQTEYLNNKKQELIKKRKNFTPMTLIKKIDLQNFGTGRQIRFAKDSNNQTIIVLAQHQKRVSRDSFAGISCITAINLKGEILYQIGEPNNDFDHTLISCDLPIQVSDINNDGKDEVIFAKDFYLYVIDAETGNIIKSSPTPYIRNDEDFISYPFDRLNVDAIRVADFLGTGVQDNLIIKDRYANVFALDKDFNIMWKYHHKNTGHFPYIFDYNNDGKDEMFVGYDLVNSKGEIQFTLPINQDHTDEILYTEIDENCENLFYLASGNEGFNVVNIKGEIVHSTYVGHAQRISIAKYDLNRKGLQIAVTSFWGNTGILYLFDKDCNIIQETELIGNGNVITPIDYMNNKEALFVLSASSKYGGLMDKDLDVVVPFPNDNHPDTCVEIFDIDNDGVDEIITFDEKQLWIYKNTTIKNPIKYQKYPHNAMSNYRGEYLIRNKKQ